MQFFLFPVHPPDAAENSIIHYFFPDDIIIADLRQESGYNFFFSAGFCISIKNFHFFADIRTGIQSLYDDPLADFISIHAEIHCRFPDIPHIFDTAVIVPVQIF